MRTRQLLSTFIRTTREPHHDSFFRSILPLGRSGAECEGPGHYGPNGEGTCGLVRCNISQTRYLVPRGTSWYRETAIMPIRYPLPAVIGIEVYTNDVVVVRAPGRPNEVDNNRSDIKEFSKASRERLAFVAANSDVVFTSMLTLTYPREFPNDGRDVKRNLNHFLVMLRKKVPALEYLWFLEFQKRGAPHIHLLIRGARVNKPMMQWVSQTWYRVCGTGDVKHLAAGTRLERIKVPNGARNYAVKYAHKMQQKSVPPNYRNVGRFWGCTRTVKPVIKSEHACTADDLVGALEAGGWHWMKDDTVCFKTLYGASKALTDWVSRGMLELSTSDGTDATLHHTEDGGNYGYQTVSNV